MLPGFVEKLKLPQQSQCDDNSPISGPRGNPPRRGYQQFYGRNNLRRARWLAVPQTRTSADSPAATIPLGWRTQRSAMLVLKGLEHGTTTEHVYRSLNTHGTIAFIEIDERGPIRTARVRFEPPPHSVGFFNQGRCLIRGIVSHWASVEFPRQADDNRAMKTPIGNVCPETATLDLTEVSFGLLLEPTAFMAKNRVIAVGNYSSMKLTIDFKRKSFTLKFPVVTRSSDVGLERRQYKVDIKFDNIKELHRVNHRTRSTLMICLNNPPTAWRMRNSAFGTFKENRLVWGERELWVRCTEITPLQDAQLGPVSLSEDHQFLDFGRWTTYRLDIGATSSGLLSTIETHLIDWNVRTDATNFAEIPNRKPTLWALVDNDDLLSSDEPPNSLPFDVRYQLEVCISHGVLNEYNITSRFIGKLAKLSQVKVMNFNKARLILEYAADQGYTIHNPMNLLENESALNYTPPTARLPDHCALMRKVIITPTKVYLYTPTVETTNRVIRQFKAVQDNFLRVQFADDSGRITGCEGPRDDDIYARAFRVLRHGIVMGGVHWKFLASGNSQIRESGAYFFYETSDITCDSIRKWMGRFSHIKAVAKYAARLGQCFSTTRPAPRGFTPNIVRIDDIENGEHCFTDGVGKISVMLSDIIGQDWNIPPPSAIQFRMGGCKGVLVAWPDVTGADVHIRKSQEKFLAEFSGLEVIRCSQYACATLNRQIISVLTCLGVPAQAFVDMMNEQLSSYDAAMENPDKAADLLSRFVDGNQMTKTIEEMVLNGFMDDKEPFVHTLLQLWRSWSIKDLKEKARLVVEKSAFVLGGVDETGTLRGYSAATEGLKQYGKELLPQVFLQIPDPECRTRYKAVTGLCLVGRNPSLHPGDIRVVMAVDSPHLKHIRNVVIFPRGGDRDIPGMCSGGDLDGDDFFVIWDPRLLPKEWGCPPMDYTPELPLEEKDGVTSDALRQFFVLFMKNNNLPLIALAHLATADYEDEGAKDEKCLELAKLHSKAVDFVKTGLPAEWQRSMEPQTWPHFMERGSHHSYHSTTALGQLYDMAKQTVFNVNEGYKLPFDSRILNAFKLSNDLLKTARRIKTQYDIAIRRALGQMGINTEFELFTSFVMSKPRVGSSYKLQEKVGQESYALKKLFRDLCAEEAEKLGGSSREALKQFVAAMYRVTWEEVRIALHEAHRPHILRNGKMRKRRINARLMPLISFPWLFDGVLGDIRGGDAAKQKATRLARFQFPVRLSKTAVVNVERWDAREEAVDYTRMPDGRLIHRGEILHLFHHDDDDDDELRGSDEAEENAHLAAEGSLIDLDDPVETGSVPSQPAGSYLEDLALLIEPISDTVSTTGGRETNLSIDTALSEFGTSRGGEDEEEDEEEEVTVVVSEAPWERFMRAAGVLWTPSAPP